VEGASVHPRVRGEHLNSHKAGLWDDGSSPRIRGIRTQPKSSGSTSRFIPAHAGNTIRLSALRATSSVHPRACGEHRSQIQSNGALGGSSPRMRGTRSITSRGLFDERFIPAHAGNTWPRAPRELSLPVHPRAYGEHICWRSATVGVHGSSPRIRGTRRIGIGDARAVGSSPRIRGTPLSGA